MNLLRVYLDTSVFGGCFESRFRRGSKALFDMIREGRVVPLISDILIAEIARAPLSVQNVLAEILRKGVFERLEVGESSIALQEAYLSDGVVTETYADDALHVAQATLAKADVIASWNFRHLVHPVRIRAFNAVNARNGFGSIVILTPDDVVEVIEEGQDRETEGET